MPDPWKLAATPALDELARAASLMGADVRETTITITLPVRVTYRVLTPAQPGNRDFPPEPAEFEVLECHAGGLALPFARLPLAAAREIEEQIEGELS